MGNDGWKELIGKAKEIAGATSKATEPALPTTGQTSGCLPFYEYIEYIASKGDARKLCLGQCPDLKLLTPWPTRPVKLQLYQKVCIQLHENLKATQHPWYK